VTDSRDISHLSAQEFAQRINERSIIVQPLGALEQHGPHLPLATDSIIAESVARDGVQLAASRGVDAWLLPTLTFSKSNEHAWCPGTIWLSAATMQAVVCDIGRSVSTSRCRKLVFLNGHGGNSSLISMMNRELRLQFGLMTFLTHPSLPADQGGGSDSGESGMGIHGGHDETSLMLHLRPDLVDMSKAKRSIPEEMKENTYVRFGGSVQFGWLSNDFDESGVIGDPEGANAAHGSHGYENAVNAFCGALLEIDAYNVRGG
jgi:creatinine amidohydrolase